MYNFTQVTYYIQYEMLMYNFFNEWWANLKCQILIQGDSYPASFTLPIFLQSHCSQWLC